MALGACAYGLANKMMCSNSSFEKEMKKMKKTGMEALNNNVWIATTESGNPLLTTATTGGAGEIVASSLESSTVDLATEFSNMVIVQRAYSAAGKIITTSDEMLQELTNLI